MRGPAINPVLAVPPTPWKRLDSRPGDKRTRHSGSFPLGSGDGEAQLLRGDHNVVPGGGGGEQFRPGERRPAPPAPHACKRCSPSHDQRQRRGPSSADTSLNVRAKTALRAPEPRTARPPVSAGVSGPEGVPGDFPRPAASLGTGVDRIRDIRVNLTRKDPADPPKLSSTRQQAPREHPTTRPLHGPQVSVDSMGLTRMVSPVSGAVITTLDPTAVVRCAPPPDRRRARGARLRPPPLPPPMMQQGACSALRPAPHPRAGTPSRAPTSGSAQGRWR